VGTKASRKKIRRDASIVRSLDISLLTALIFRRKSQRTTTEAGFLMEDYFLKFSIKEEF